MSDDMRSASCRPSPCSNDPVLQDFDDAMQTPDIPVAVAAITALTGVLKRSQARTAMQLQTELRLNVEKLLAAKQDGVQEYVQLGAACELFMRYVTRTSNDEHGKTLDQMEFKRSLIRRGDGFKDQSIRSRDAIAKYGSAFVRDGAVLLLHGYSSVVMRLLEQVKDSHKRFKVICTEAIPGNQARLVVSRLQSWDVPVTVISDSAVAFYMGKVDMVLVGAQGVVENGGILNKMGTLQVAIVAKSYNKPLYVASESYKFARIFPLDQADLSWPGAAKVPDEVSDESKRPALDFTPPEYITLLFTDLGVLTPAAVSDELIKLYQ